MESTLREYNTPRKRNLGGFVANTWHHLAHLLLEVQNVNNRRFTEFFDRYFHIPLPIVTKHELGLPFPPRKLHIKFGTNPSTIFLVIVVTNRHTQTDTNQRREKHTPSLLRGELVSWSLTSLFSKNMAISETTHNNCSFHCYHFGLSFTWLMLHGYYNYSLGWQNRRGTLAGCCRGILQTRRLRE